MKVLKVTEEKRHDTELEAVDYIAEVRKASMTSDFSVSKASYTYKSKKQKGVTILECWVSTIVKDFGPLWTDEEIDAAKE